MTSRKIQTVVVAGDIHLPFHDPKALKTFMQFLADTDVDKLVLNGDIADLSSMSSHGDASTVVSLKDELAYVNDWLDDVRNVVGPRCRIEYVEGNHEDRYHRYVGKNAPNLRGLTSVPEMLKLKQRRIGWTPYGKVHFVSPKLGATHGVYAGDHFAKQHLVKYGCSLVVGHTHRTQIHTLSVAGEEAHSVRGCYGLGTLAPIDDIGYIKGPSGWSQSFGLFYILPDGTFTPYILSMNKHKFVWNGKVYG